MEYKQLLEKFGEGRDKVAVRFQPSDAFLKGSIFKNHRKYVEHLFQGVGVQVMQHEHHYNESGEIRECGLIYCRTDSDIMPLIEVWGIVGLSVRRLEVVQEARD
jgi:hypothetical protein